MSTRRDFTPDYPFFLRVEELQAQIAAGAMNVQMAAGQLIADGFNVEFDSAQTLMIGSVDVAAAHATGRAQRAKASVLQKYAVDLAQEHGLRFDPNRFVARISGLLGDFERGSVSFGDATQRMYTEFGLPADASIDMMLTAHEMFRSEMLSTNGMRFTAVAVKQDLWASGVGVITY